LEYRAWDLLSKRGRGDERETGGGRGEKGIHTVSSGAWGSGGGGAGGEGGHLPSTMLVWLLLPAPVLASTVCEAWWTHMESGSALYALRGLGLLCFMF
jgi:hypothetical protein